MACTAMLMKPKEAISNWNATFPSQQTTQEQSTMFMKKLLAVAVSEILYLRSIFPEKAFGDRSLEGMNLKILSEKCRIQGACQVIQWMKGCFDALEKKYLREIQLAVYLDEGDADTAVESYVFRFSYHGDQTSFTCNNEEVASTSSSSTMKDIRKATLSLLRTTVLLTQHLEPLPEPAFMGMKLLYYDEVTPPDYEPEGFRSCSTSSYTFAEEPLNIKIGEVNTNFHQLKFRVKTAKSQFTSEEPDNAGPANLSSVTPLETPVSSAKVADANNNSSLGDLNISAPSITLSPEKSAMECEENLNFSPLTTSTSIGNGLASETTLPEHKSPRSEHSDSSFHSMGGCVRCPCEDLDDDGLMIQCKSCGYWQHGFCFAVTISSDAPANHYCTLCADIKNPKKLPTDFYLHSLEKPSQKEFCLWRRALQACFETKKLTVSQLCMKLNITTDHGNSLMSRLEEEGFVQPSQGRIRSRKDVKKDVLMSEGVPRYLTRQKGMKKCFDLGEGSRSTEEKKNISADKPANTQKENEMLSLVKDTSKLSVSQDETSYLTRRNKRKQIQNLNLSISDSQDVTSGNTKRSSKRVKTSSSLHGIKF